MLQTPGKNPVLSADQTRIPPRFWWLKRLSLATMMLFIAMAGLRLWWEWRAQSRIDRLIAEEHAIGKPILLDDFPTKSLSENENAAIWISLAERNYSKTGNEYALDTSSSDPPSEADYQNMAAAMRSHSRELKLLRQARACKDAEWESGKKDRSFVFRANFRPPIAQLSRLLGWSAQYSHHIGNDGDAIAYLRDQLALANARIKLAPSGMSMAVAMTMWAHATQEIIAISPEISLTRPAPMARNGIATRADIQALIADLLDEKPFRDQCSLALMGNAMIVIEQGSDALQQEIGFEPLVRFLSPVTTLRAERIARRCAQASGAIAEEQFRQSRLRYPPDVYFNSTSRLQAMVRESSQDGVETLVRFYYTNVAERRVAAAMLAMRLYVLDHNGKIPERLDELVPGYLPRTPNDPFALNPESLRYLPNHQPPVIYSVGYNAIDDGGSTKSMTYSPNPYRWYQEDAVFPFKVPLTTTAPANSN